MSKDYLQCALQTFNGGNWYGWKNRPHRKSQKLMREVQPSSELVFKKYMKKPKQSY